MKNTPVTTFLMLAATTLALRALPATEYNFAIGGYQVFRDGVRIADLSAVFRSWMDNSVKPGTTYRYTVKARDMAGNLSPDGSPAEVFWTKPARCDSD